MDDAAASNNRWSARDAALSLAGAGGATAVLYLAGSAFWDAYYSRLGVPAHEIVLPPSAYILRGFLQVVLVLFTVALVSLLFGIVALKNAKVELSIEAHGQNLLAYTAIACLTVAATSLAQVNQDSIHAFGISFHISVFQLVVVVATSLFSLLILLALTANAGRLWRHLIGPTFSGRILLAIIATGSLVFSANVGGAKQAGDEAWHITPHTEVSFTFANDTTSRSYFFVAHANGAYYVREVNDIGAISPRVLIVPETGVRTAILQTTP